MHNDIIKKILRKIKKYDTIVIARHISPDPDAICSQIGLRDAIRENYPHKKVYAVGTGVSRFKKFGSLDSVDYKSLKNVLLITADVPNYNRIDGIEGLEPKEVIKIDHHPFEDNFGGIEWIDEGASSAAQMIALLLLLSNYKISTNVAENLFLGIVSDSGRFVFPYTSVLTFQIVEALIERSGLQFTKTYQKLYERPIEEVRFNGYLCMNLKVSENGFGYIEIPNEVFKEYNVDMATASNLVNDFNFIKGVYVWTFITYDEKTEMYRANIRSNGPVINEVASKYGGGGHKFASGVRTKERKNIDGLLESLDEVCKDYKELLQKDN